MASSVPPPPKHGGSGGFIAAAVIMLLLTGGLIYWKVSKKPAPSPVPKASATAQQQPVFDQPPPPPPPPSAVPEAGPKEKVVSHGHWRGGCSGTCRGSAPALLRSALSAKAGQARGCYERALRVNPTLKGHLVVNVRVGPEGQVCGASIQSNSLGSPAVANCVLQMFRAGKFPAPHGGCVDTRVPMNFVPKT